MTSSKTVLPWVPWRTSDVVRGVALVGGAALLILSIALALDLRPGVATILIAALDGTMIMAVFIFGVRRYRVPWSIAGLRVPRRPSTALLLPWLVLLMSLTLSALYGVAARYGGWESLEPSTLPADTLGSGMLKVINMLVLTLWVPMSEELFFRGFLLTGLLHRMGPAGAIVASSLLFAVGHGSLGALIPTLIAGLLLSWLYLRTRSLVPCFMVHSSQNIIAVSFLA